MALPRTPSFRLDGRRALVTGAGRGIGQAAAVALAEAGAHVVLAARTAEEIAATADGIGEIGGAAEWAVLDVCDTDAVERLVADRGPFDVLVNNAGSNRPAETLDVTPEDFDFVMGLNVRAAFFVARAVAKQLVEAGRPGSIINMSSQLGHVGGARRGVYAASKHAMEGFTKSMAIEFGASGIRVNTICPTFIETPLTRGSLADPAFRASVLDKIKIGRLGHVEDIMGAVLFLASDASALVTGSALMLDGGWTAE